MKLRTCLERSLVIEETAEIVCFVLLFFAIVIQIVFRVKFIAEALSYAPIWTEELSRWLFVYIVFLGAGVGIQRNEHIAIDFFVERIKPVFRLGIKFFTNALILFCCVLFVYYGVVNAKVAWHQQSHTMPFFTYGVVYGIVPVAFTLMFFRTIGVVVLSWLDYRSLKKAEG